MLMLLQQGMGRSYRSLMEVWLTRGSSPTRNPPWEPSASSSFSKSYLFSLPFPQPFSVCRNGEILPFANGGKTDKRQFSDSAPAMSQ